MQPVLLPDRPLKCLHLGDSYTIGEGVPLEDGWPFQLHDQLEREGARISRAHLLAKTGWTTNDLLEALDSARLLPEWDFTTLCIGVNNQYQGLEITRFEKELRDLLQRAMELRSGPDAAIVLLSIPDWGVSPFADERDSGSIAGEIDHYNQVAASVAGSLHIAFLDWTPLTRQLGREPGAFTSDQLHPSPTQYAGWASYLMQQIQPRN